jgi:hypothetical protein
MATTPSTTTTIRGHDNVSLPTATMTVTTPSVIAQQAPPATTLAPSENQNQENSQVPDPTAAPFESNEQQPNNWQELNNVLEADRYDPQSVVQDFLEDLADGRHTSNFQMYLTAKQQLISKDVVVGTGNKALNWKVRDDVHKNKIPCDQEFEKVGICNFDFTNKTEPSPSRDPRERRINLLSLLIHLWPGNWKEQLNQLNRRIQLQNEYERRWVRNGRRAKAVREITQQEFWIWWGIVIAAPRIEGRKGNMWDRTEPEGYGVKVDMGNYMVEHRFKAIREFIPFLFADESRKENDPWWQFSKAVDDYNQNRSETFLASFLKLMDESMLAYRPQTTKTGNLDHLSMIARKPEDLGTEFKVIADSATTMCLFLEIQQGKKGMSDAESLMS